MLKRFFFAALLILLLSTSAFAMKNEPDGFWGIKWGDKISQHLGLDLKLSKDGTHYTRPDVILQLGQSALIMSTEYHFDEKEGFFGVLMVTAAGGNIQQLNIECFRQWGEPDSVTTGGNGDTIILAWEGERLSASLTHSFTMAKLLMLDKGRYARVLANKYKE